MQVTIESAQPDETVEAPKAETPEWINFSGNETADLPAGIEPDAPIAIRLREGTELCAFAGDSFDLPLGNWDHADHEKDIVAYRLLSAKEARKFIEAKAVIKYVSKHLDGEIDHWAGLVHDLKARYDNPYLNTCCPSLLAPSAPLKVAGIKQSLQTLFNPRHGCYSKPCRRLANHPSREGADE
ncbi:hypothetical protein [Microbulbifer spongiae]|uniref:Uncharacterized protein n=1 Tax=Microbulbifer spongiae TaxID=2944933 RepID=A0ABY9EGV8_9GAMM|nr:hypothetical protein [Microbulbifer sp. MI-G]WKD51701.1 hypothetical protein M8T91_18490 [Microbulbifer sp. MI-G]